MTTATITITIEVPDAGQHVEALQNLAAVMAVQAEDGLWSLGSPEAEDEAGPSVLVADITSCTTAVTVA